MRNHKYLFLITVSFFVLGLINIHFSLFGILCMILPFILLRKEHKKTWCQGYCPRAGLYSTCGKSKKWKPLPTPRFLISKDMRWIMLVYFGISLFFILMSTLGVVKGMKPAMEYLRFFILFPLPFEMPQLLDIINLSPWLTHLSYRIYSMMMTTTILGLLLAMFYKPRTWCAICPISTISDTLLKN